MTIIYIVLAYCIITAIIAAFIALKKNVGFIPAYISTLGGPITIILYLLRLQTRKQERAYYNRKYFK